MTPGDPPQTASELARRMRGYGARYSQRVIQKKSLALAIERINQLISRGYSLERKP